MTAITPRVPKIDWTKGFDRHWNDDNAGVTHVYNAVSFLFPQGERYFMDVVREVVADRDLSDTPELAADIKAFIAQESVHGNQHELYIEVLKRQGFRNTAHDFLERMLEQAHRQLTPVQKLAMVASYEHFTAVLGDFTLTYPEKLAHAPEHMALVWGWHAAEETEHKAVCFDLYKAIGGTWFTRVGAFITASIKFNYMFLLVYFSMLSRDGCFRPSRILVTLRQSLPWFWGTSGVCWHVLWHGARYLSPWFHPWNHNNRQKLDAWLAKNQDLLREIRQDSQPVQD